jgi:hypothetical protein
LGCNVSNNCIDSSGTRVWWDRRGFSRDREDLVLYIPGDVRDILCFRLERQRSTIIEGVTVSSLEGRDDFSRPLSYAACVALNCGWLWIEKLAVT